MGACMAIPLIYSFRSIAVRKGSSAMAIAGIALVVIVFIALLALADGFRKAVETSGRPDNLIILRKGADAELQSQVTREAGRIISELPLVAQDERGKRLFTAESVIILSRPKRSGGDTNIVVRGTTPESVLVHSEVRLKEGRWFSQGSDEAVIGSGLARRLEGFSLNQLITSGKHQWKITGIFEANGSALESEIWMDSELLQTAFNRGNIFQSFLFRAVGSQALALQQLDAILENDPRLRSLEARREDEYYKKQSQLMTQIITTLGGMLTAIMAIGAVTGAMNTMYAAASQRQREIGCLLAMGFSPGAVWLAFIVESLMLSSVGAVLGCAASFYFQGMKTGTVNWQTFSETAFEFHITLDIALSATLLALSMGFIGGVFPAFRAARMKVVDALRRT